LMRGIREAIAQGAFEQFREQTRAGWGLGDITPR
jgi:queuine tRNA-ribosyltransferase